MSDRNTEDTTPLLTGKPLRFEHLVQINDPADPRVQPLTRHQLWRGLVIRAEQPGLFMPWLDQVETFVREEGRLDRTLHFGNYTVQDQVRFFTEDSVHYEIVSGDPSERFTLTMQIEEPVPGSLFVRFRYLAHSADHHAQSPLSEMIRGAYLHADQDTIFRIRQFAATGVFDE